MQERKTRVAILHGAGYAGGELITLLLRHPNVSITAVTSRSQAGKPVSESHAKLRGQTDLRFVAPDAVDVPNTDAAFICAEHGQGAAAVMALRGAGFQGLIVDLSADHRLSSTSAYHEWYGLEHPNPFALDDAVYGLAEVRGDDIRGAKLIANPGCFATGLSLSLWPLSKALGSFSAHVTALTGASGSGGRPSATTHYPSRDGNVRAYKPMVHRHLAEVQETIGPDAQIRFVPVSGPFTRGIWGTAHVALPAGIGEADVTDWYTSVYGDKTFLRLSPGVLPELLPAVGTPFCDLGWVVVDGHLVVGFALDNLLKGAASQAVQNMNLALGWDEALGLLP